MEQICCRGNIKYKVVNILTSKLYILGLDSCMVSHIREILVVFKVVTHY